MSAEGHQQENTMAGRLDASNPGELDRDRGLRKLHRDHRIAIDAA